MSKKHSYEFIKSQFEKEGYKLLTKEYKNAFQKLEYICPNGHIGSIRWNNWQSGARCYFCGRYNIAQKHRLDLNFIKKSFQKEGYKLLTKEYKNAFQKLDYICPNGHKHSITWANWHSGYRCPYCSIEIVKTKLKLDFSMVKNSFEKEGYQLLTEEYRNNNQKLDYICPNGHKHSISWGHWQQGQRCPYCSGSAKKTIGEIGKAFEAESYTLLSKEYKNNRQKLEYICSSGHRHSISWANWSQGQRCPYCITESKMKYKENLRKYKIYREAINNLTNRIYYKNKRYINPRNLIRDKYSYHIDHIYSIIDGFKNDIPIDIISNPNNLRIILAKDNQIKNHRSYISKMMLYHLAV